MSTEGPNYEIARLKSLLHISQSLNSNLQIDHLLPLIMISARDLLEAEASSLFLLDEKNDHLYCEVAIGEKGKMIKQYLRLEKGEGIAGWVAQEGESLLIKDAYDDHRFDSSWDKISGFRTKSIICVPLYLKENLVGTLEVMNKKNGGYFEPSDMELIEYLGNMAAVALDNARLHDGLQVKIKELHVLTTIEKKIATGWSFDRLAYWTLKKSIENLSASGGSVMMFNQTTQALEIKYTWGIITNQVQDKEVMHEKGIVGISYREKRSVRIKSIHADTRLVGEPIQAHESSSMICAPIQMAEKIFGFIVVNDRNDGFVFSRDDVSSLANVAERLAIVYNTENTFDELKKTTDDQNSALQLMKKILPQGTPNISELKIYSKYIPFSNIGGDFYRFIDIGEDKVGILVIDVSGHGLSAALVSVMANTIISSFPQSTLEKPGHFFSKINRNLMGRLGGNFITATYVVINYTDHTITYANAGHPAPVLFKKEAKEIEYLKTSGPLLGIWDQPEFTVRQTSYRAGDRLLLFTDGLLEHYNSQKVTILDEMEFTELIQNVIYDNVKTLPDAIIKTIKDHSEIVEFDDDVTLLLVEMVN